MTRGDQRERDRAKAQAKQAAKQKSAAKGGDPLKRNESDAAALQAKVAAKRAAKEEQAAASADASNAGKVPAPRKKQPVKKDTTTEDLLSAGLTAGKKKRAK
jgi:hypothetical protein